MSQQARMILAIAVVLHVALLLTLANGFTDDGFIHIRYADNLINRGEYSFNPGEVSFGTTSPLWVMILAAAGKVAGGGEDLITYSRVCSWFAGIVSVLLMFVLARRTGVRAVGAAWCAVAFAAHVWFVRWTALSMETSTAVMAVAAAGIFSVRAHEDSRSALLLGFFCGVAALLRPEAYLLMPVLVGAFVLNRGKQPPWRHVVLAILIFAAMLVPWLLFAKLHIGHFLPNTAGAKSGGLITDPILFAKKFVPIVKIAGSAEGVAIGLIVLAALLRRGKARMFAPPHRFMLLWVIALPVAYVVFDIQVLSRYMLLTSPFVVVLGYLAIEDLVVARAQWGRIAFVGVTAAFVVVNLIVYFGVVIQPSRAFSADLQTHLRDLALFINTNSDEDAVVAAADIGYLSFYSQRRILDLGGLVDDVTSELREAHTYEEIVDQGLYLGLDKFPQVDYFIDRVLEPNRFADAMLEGYRFESVKVVVIENLGIKKPGPYYYTLYRLHRHD